MKKWLLVMCTALVPLFTMSANAGSINPPELFRFVQYSNPASNGPSEEQDVAGPQFPDKGLSRHSEQFRSWVIAQAERRGPVTEVPPSPVPPSAVPLPAAAWLFGSALVALAGVARRKRA